MDNRSEDGCQTRRPAPPRSVFYVSMPSLTSLVFSEVVVSVSLDPRAARTGHPDPIALDRSVHLAAATVLLEKGVEVGEYGHRKAYARLLIRRCQRSSSMVQPLCFHLQPAAGRPGLVQARLVLGDQALKVTGDARRSSARNSGTQPTRGPRARLARSPSPTARCGRPLGSRRRTCSVGSCSAAAATGP
jgi:hypothetical protein